MSRLNVGTNCWASVAWGSQSWQRRNPGATPRELRFGVILIISALLVLRFARPLIRKALRRLFEAQSISASGYELTAAEIQKRVDTIETLGVSAIRLVVFALVTALVLAVLNLGPVVAALGIVTCGPGVRRSDFVRDYLAGCFILLENQSYVGDVIRVAGMIYCAIEASQLREPTIDNLQSTTNQ